MQQMVVITLSGIKIFDPDLRDLTTEPRFVLCHTRKMHTIWLLPISSSTKNVSSIWPRQVVPYRGYKNKICFPLWVYVLPFHVCCIFCNWLAFLFPSKKAFVTAIKHLSGNYAEKENMFHLITLFIPRLFVGMTSEENFGSEIGRASVFQFSEVRFRIEGTWIV